MRKVNHRIFEKDICENKEKGESLKMSEKTKIKKAQIGNKKTFGQYFRAHWQLYVMIAPPIIMLLIFAYAPMYGVILAFKDYKVSLGIWNEILYDFLIIIILRSACATRLCFPFIPCW